MVTHYDMHTGQPLDEERADTREEHEATAEFATQLRLVTVDEAALTERRVVAAAPAVLMLPIDVLTAR